MKITSNAVDRIFKAIKVPSLPSHCEHSNDMKVVYKIVENGNDDLVRFYMGRTKSDPKEVLVWYPSSGALHYSFGRNMQAALDMAIRDGWLYG